MDTAEFDTVLDLCRDQHRRIVLAVLADQRRSLTVNDLRNAVIKHNHDIAITETPTDVATRIHVELCHVHLPKIAESGVIEYDANRQLVVPTVKFDTYQPYISPVIEADPGLETPIGL